MNTHQLLILLVIGYIVFSLDKKQKFFPVPIILVLLGIGLSFIPYFSSLSISKELIFMVFLPALLFTSAYRFPVKTLRENKWVIGSLGTLGLLLTVGVLGISIYFIGNFFVSLSLTASLLVASILAPTDPVSVVSILKKSSSDEKIADIVEGESLLNDGTSIVLFTVFLEMYLHQTGFSIGSFVTEFLYVALGGVAIGAIFGWLMSKLVHFTHHREYQVMLSIIVAYGSFYIGEGIGVSGVLSTVTAGLMLSYEFGRNIKEGHFRSSLNGFWDIVEPSVLAILFLMIGVQSADYLQFNGWGLAFLIFVVSVLARYIVLLATFKGVPKWRNDFSGKDATLIAWTGIKGTMSVALLMGLEAQNNGSSMLISLTFAAILLSLIIQSVGVYPLTKKLSK
ncbi:cation:proton antiporter [Oceanobacillus manasiensis]|uniref:cation:proton antiporter n=1 Tax=Oceanobacillus manasiensis TaxID=586413 RepID=UPI0005A8049C|nr:sodium:proton antiporter [Oceanobacillus manasiensis]